MQSVYLGGGFTARVSRDDQLLIALLGGEKEGGKHKALAPLKKREGIALEASLRAHIVYHRRWARIYWNLGLVEEALECMQEALSLARFGWEEQLVNDIMDEVGEMEDRLCNPDPESE